MGLWIRRQLYTIIAKGKSFGCKLIWRDFVPIHDVAIKILFMCSFSHMNFLMSHVTYFNNKHR